MINKEVQDSIDDLHSASNRILITVLLLAIVTLFGLWIREISKNSGNAKTELKKCEEKNEKLELRVSQLIVEKDSIRFHYVVKENIELQKILAKQDSLKKGFETTINKLK